MKSKNEKVIDALRKRLDFLIDQLPKMESAISHVQELIQLKEKSKLRLNDLLRVYRFLTTFHSHSMESLTKLVQTVYDLSDKELLLLDLYKVLGPEDQKLVIIKIKELIGASGNS